MNLVSYAVFVRQASHASADMLSCVLARPYISYLQVMASTGIKKGYVQQFGLSNAEDGSLYSAFMARPVISLTPYFLWPSRSLDRCALA